MKNYNNKILRLITSCFILICSLFIFSCKSSCKDDENTENNEDEKQDEKEEQPVEKKEFTVKFNSNGGSSVSNQTIKKGGKVTKPSNPTRKNYDFINWYLNDNVYNFNTEVTKDLTLTAKWKFNGVYVNKVTLNKTSHSMNVGEKVTLTATVEPSNATNKTVTWTSSNKNVATVSNGTVTAVGSGTTTITATADGKKIKTSAREARSMKKNNK